MRDGFTRAPTGGFGRIGVALSISYSQQGFSASDMGSRFSLRATDAHKPESLLVSELSQRVLVLRRVIGKPPGRVERLVAYSTFARISMPMTTDPLVEGSKNIRTSEAAPVKSR